MPNPANSSHAAMLTPEEQAAADHMRYVALMQRRSAPPRCHPITIVIMVMSGGMLFIGLTMTIIANWPGSTSIGENPLKIAGPVLLSVGGAGFILGIVLVGTLNKRERKQFVKKVDTMATSRVALSQSQQSISAINTRGPGSMAPQRYKATSAAAHDDSMASGGAGSIQKGAGVDSARQTVSSGPGGYSSSGAGEDDTDLPQPVRVRKPRKSGGGSRENLAANESSELLGPPANEKEAPPTYASLGPGRGAAKYSDYTDESGAESNREGEKKKKRPPTTAPKPSTTAPKPSTTAPSVPQGGEEAYRLRVHVKAAPGAAVLIHQGSKENIHNKSTASIETDF